MQFQELAVIRARQVIIIGTSDGVFTYRPTPFSLAASDVGQATKDPVLGINCPAGIATYNNFGAVTTLLSADKGAFFQYRDLGSATQGQVILSIASTTGFDPVNNGFYDVGMIGIDPFGQAIQVVGASIKLFNALIGAATGGRMSVTSVANPPGNTNPFIRIDAPEQVAAGHLQMLLQGTSPDGTQPGQLAIGQVSGANGLLTTHTQSMVEIQANVTPGEPPLTLLCINAGDPYLGSRATTDTFNRLRIDGSGPGSRTAIKAGPGNAGQDTQFYNSAAGHWATDDLVANISGTAETWHSLGTLAGYTVNVGRYRMTVDNEVELDIDVSAGGANAAAVSFSNAPLPALYRPLLSRRLPMGTNRVITAGDPSPRVLLNNTGDVQVNQAANNTANLSCNARVPLD